MHHRPAYNPPVIFVWALALLSPVLIVVAFVRRKRASSVAAGALAEVSAMLDPGQPTAEALASLREGEVDEEDEDDGDPED